MGAGLPTVALVSIIVGAAIGIAIIVCWIVMIAVYCYKRTNVHSQTTVLHPSMQFLFYFILFVFMNGFLN